MNKSLAVAALIVALAGCRQEPAAEPATAAPQPAPPAVTTAPPADLAEKEVDTKIELGGPEFVTSSKIGSPEPTTGELTSITAGAPIRAALETRPLPAGYVVRLLLRKGKTVVETTKDVGEGARTVTAEIEKTAGLEPGEWTLELWLGGTLVEQRTVTVQKGGSS